jgi:hypothetical protein
MPAITIGNVLVGQATVYTAPANTALVADRTALGATWTAPWVYVGATEEGVSFNVGTDTNDIQVEEQSIPVAVTVNKSNIAVVFTVSEDTLENMKLAYGRGTIVSTIAGSPGTGNPPEKTLTLSDTLDQLAVAFEATNPLFVGGYRRVYIPSVLSSADVTTVYRRAANNRSYQVSLRAVCATSAIKIVDQTGANP